MHYHIIKKESWYIQEGQFKFDWIDTETATLHTNVLDVGDSVTIERGQPHQLTALKPITHVPKLYQLFLV